MLMHTGTEAKPVRPALTTVAWRLGRTLEYAARGRVFIAGATISGYATVEDHRFRPRGERTRRKRRRRRHLRGTRLRGLKGLLGPARPGILGLTRGSTDARRAATSAVSPTRRGTSRLHGRRGHRDQRSGGRALLREHYPCSSRRTSSGCRCRALDGGVDRRGAAYLAGLATDVWGVSELDRHRVVDRTFEPDMDPVERERLALVAGGRSMPRLERGGR